MRKLIISTMLLLIAAFAIGALRETYTGGWDVINEIQSSGDEPTDLAVDERTYSGVLSVIEAEAGGDEKISYKQLTRSYITKANSIRFRCMGKTADTTVTYDIYVGNVGRSDDCALTYLGQLSFTVGTQSSTYSDYEYADQVSITEGDTNADWVHKSAADNRVAEAGINLHGDDLLVIVPSTSGSDSKLQAKYF